MKLFRFIKPSSSAAAAQFLIVSLLAGVMNAGVLVIVNFASQTAYGTVWSFYLFFIFLLAVSVYFVAQSHAFGMVAVEVEATVYRARLEVLDLVRRCELLSIEATGEARILGAMTGEAQRLSAAMAQLTTGLQSALVAVITAAYIAYVSGAAFALWVISVAVAAYMILRQWGISQDLLIRATVKDGEFQDTSAALLHGFKEVKLSRRRADALYEELFGLADESRAIRAEAQAGMNRSFVVGQVLFFLLIGSMVFLLPALGTISAKTLGQATMAVLFVLGPVSMIIGAIPALSSAEAAARAIYDLEATLQAQIKAESSLLANDPAPLPERKDFRSLELRGVTFRYPRNERGSGFVLGPLDFRVNAGETVFITGGNGAGKSTFLRILTGLYPAQGGEILVDSRPVDEANLQDVRDRIAAVFSDYFLFRKLYGLTDTMEPDEADALLREMAIADKAAIRDGAFTTVQLSTGQRKRLALIAAVLEGKPLLVLDEWAADQDPVFRRKFYEEVLPSLKARGITIIAATHDDRWFHLADRQIRLSEGLIVPVD
ncbi:cyclic peptide export ABC transporter [Acidisphaera sp. S103]|uniref:cyclic peptide export ABC transporter n=1 Tax=Acidisphaera sp. S103 TaxID=1747223 RepID=UPI00131CF1C8|nr:cyclic peptide export ABC transporter [Acidisphaera sp. S103]